MDDTIPSPLAAFVARRLDELQHRKSQKEVARAAGIASANFLAMIKRGTTKLPLDRVADLATALECDRDELMRLALRQSHSEEVVNSIENALRANEGAQEETAFRPGALKLRSELTAFQAESAALLQSIAETESRINQVKWAQSRISLQVQRLTIAAARVLEQIRRARR